ncbi:penicillin-binding protein 1A [Lyticum sinuosum]|uniref:Penicillin-binding protein 1A n=1 Tax=Lyticum sinuosum TaxID=1332059 RepID=A0AAE4VLJ3_9RICK|nr:PBP1A family penicillin-binding protein [Lyticum sinuosum]MDZ5761021.1 Penicillin-binding protein 1A [Lyticum sinuosum]
MFNFSFISSIVWLGLIGIVFFTEIFCSVTSNHPGYNKIDYYSPQTVTRVYDKSGRKIGQFARENRIITKYTDIPQTLIDAFLAAEDKNFFLHQGVDIERLGFAIFQSIYNLFKHKRLVGASTITQQVVRNILIDNSRNIDRKIREIVLAYRISQLYTKEKILEIYLNHIFLGNNSYGVAAAAQSYFGKRLYDLTIAEIAVLASLPKAPSQLNPLVYPEKILIRRNWVINKMVKDGFISEEDGKIAINEPINLNKSSKFGNNNDILRDYIESVRRQLIDLFGEDIVYTKGLTVITNIDIEIQNKAYEAFITQINNYDRRHGWRGPITNIYNKNINIPKDNNYKIPYDIWFPYIKSIEKPDGMLNSQLIAIVIEINNNSVKIGFNNGQEGVIKINNMSWARKNLPKQHLGKAIKTPKDLLSIGDVILVRNKKINLLSELTEYSNVSINSQKFNKKSNKKNFLLQDEWILEQIPNVNGGIVILEPYTGNILAMISGYYGDHFNRVIQANRQPGSIFKPIVHTVALEYGLNPYTTIKDEPLSINMGSSAGGVWTPKNYTKTFLGDITLTEALAKSRNLPTVRLTLALGVPRIMEMAKRFKIYTNNINFYTKEYALGLGTKETTLLNMANAYNSIASHGFLTTPELISEIYSQDGKLIYKSKIDYENYEKNKKLINQEVIDNIYSNIEDINPDNSNSEYYPPKVLLGRSKIIKNKVYNHINNMLSDTIKWGTARGIKTKLPFAGKTGSTNSSFDSWFIGYTAQFTIGVYVGFDTPYTLGDKEYGATIALPIADDVINKLEKNYSQIPLSQFPSSTEIYNDNSWKKPDEKYDSIKWYYINN